MKIRTGFVSNSSSSSFTCEICGATESSWDASPKDCGFVECEHGHLFCDEEKLSPEQEDLDKDLARFIKSKAEHDLKYYEGKKNLASYQTRQYEKAKEFLKEIDEGKVPDFEILDYDCGLTQIECPICNFVEPSYADLSTYFSRTTNITRDEVFLEIKKVNKRRRVLRTHEYVEYCLRQQDTTVDKLLMKFKNDFGTYSKFHEYLKNLK